MNFVVKLSKFYDRKLDSFLVFQLFSYRVFIYFHFASPQSKMMLIRFNQKIFYIDLVTLNAATKRRLLVQWQ